MVSNSELSGINRLSRNLIFGWGAYFFVLVTGFIVPRQIDNMLGAELLGIWNLGWATVRYLALGNFSMVGALSRFVALYRAEGNIERLCGVRTAASIVQTIVAALTAIGAVIVAKLVVAYAHIPDPETQQMANTVLLLLGLSTAIRLLGTSAGGTITGCHRFDIQTSINAAQDVVTGFLMIVVLVFGGDLVDLAVLVLVIAILTTVVRVLFARKICPEAKVSLKLWDWNRGRELIRFGAKSTIASVPDVVIFQTVVVLLSGAGGGTDAVAYMSVGVALVRHCDHLARRAAQLFVPITSGLLGLKENERVGRLLVKMGGYGLALTLPMMLVLFIFGDLVLGLWMGPDYANAALMQVLVLGALLPVAQIGTTNVLAGLNAHGRLAIFCLFSSAFALIVGVFVVQSLGWNPVTAAGLIGFAWTSGRGVIVPIYLKVRFDVSMRRYLGRALLLPVLFNIPLAVLLFMGRSAYDADKLLESVVLCLAGFALTAGIYWQAVIPDTVKHQLGKKLGVRAWRKQSL